MLLHWALKLSGLLKQLGECEKNFHRLVYPPMADTRMRPDATILTEARRSRFHTSSVGGPFCGAD